MVTVEVTLSRRANLGAVCLHLPEYLQMPGGERRERERERERERRGKLFSEPTPWGKERPNDLGNVDYYLPPGIACLYVCAQM